MADFFSDLVGAVQGAAPQITPLLPSRFAPWPGLPQAGTEPRPGLPTAGPDPSPAAAPAGDAGSLQSELPAGFQDASQGELPHAFPPPLVDPSQPAAQALTLRQMAAPQPRPEPPFQPGQEPAAQRPLESAGLEPGLPPQASDQPALPALPPHPPSPIRPAGVTPNVSEGSLALPTPATALAQPQATPDAQPAPDQPAALKAADTPASPPARSSWVIAAAVSTPRKRKNIAPGRAARTRDAVQPQPALDPGQALFPAASADQPPARPDPAGPRPENTRQPASLAPRDSAPVTPPSPAKAPAERVETGRAPLEAPPLDAQPLEESSSRLDARPAPAARPPVVIRRPGQAVAAPEPPLKPAPLSAAGQPPRPPEPGDAPKPQPPAEAQGQTPPVRPPARRAEARLAPSAPQEGRAMGQPKMPRPVQPKVTPPAPIEAKVQPLPRRDHAPEERLADRAAASPDLAPAQGKPAQAARPSEPVQPAAPADSSAVREPVLPTRPALAPAREPEILPVPEPAQDGRRRADALAFVKSAPIAARPPAGQPEPAPTPTIHVSIGRVVVRAASPAVEPPAKRADLPRPLLSLDSYLKGKKGGQA